MFCVYLFIYSSVASKTPLSNHETHRAKGWEKKVKMVKVIQHTDWSEFLIETLSRFSHEDSLMLECSNSLLKPGSDRVWAVVWYRCLEKKLQERLYPLCSQDAGYPLSLHGLHLMGSLFRPSPLCRASSLTFGDPQGQNPCLNFLCLASWFSGAGHQHLLYLLLTRRQELSSCTDLESFLGNFQLGSGLQP